MLTVSKPFLRAQCLSRREALTQEQRQLYSKHILTSLYAMLDKKYGRPVQLLCYRSRVGEVETTALFTGACKHQRYAPRTHHSGDMHWLRCDEHTAWQAGAFGILEPATGKAWQREEGVPAIVLCPVVGFDAQGNRIGMGKGCFDRWLSMHKQHIDMVVGLAFECQRCPSIAREAHDVGLDAIITEQGWMTCPST